MRLFSIRFSMIPVLPLLAMAAAAPVHAPDPLMGPGVSRELAANRSHLVSNVRYELRLSVVAPDTARGSITIRFVTARKADVILDFRGPSLSNFTVNGASGQ